METNMLLINLNYQEQLTSSVQEILFSI